MTGLKSIGIDPGTTYSCVIHRDRDISDTIVESSELWELTSSVGHFAAGNLALVGEDAKWMLECEPENGVVGIKRQVGSAFPLDFHGRHYKPEGISGIILRHLATGTSQALAVPLAELAAVVTVPAHLGVAEKKAAHAAGEIGGLKRLELLAEPVRPAFAHSLADEPDITSLAFDLGGGTFDVAVLGMHKDRPRVCPVDGETRLGGLDWDSRIQDLLWAEVDTLMTSATTT